MDGGKPISLLILLKNLLEASSVALEGTNMQCSSNLLVNFDTIIVVLVANSDEFLVNDIPVLCHIPLRSFEFVVNMSLRTLLATGLAIKQLLRTRNASRAQNSSDGSKPDP